MKYRPFLLAAFFTLFISVSQAATYYVATDGNDTNSGTTLTTPFKTIAKAVGLSTLVAGDQIIVRGGTYLTTATITLSKVGTVSAPISLITYNGERALINFTGIAAGKRGLSLTGSYWYIKGLDICKATDNGIYITGANNTVEFCSFFENGDSGMQLSGAILTGTPIPPTTAMPTVLPAKWMSAPIITSSAVAPGSMWMTVGTDISEVPTM